MNIITVEINNYGNYVEQLCVMLKSISENALDEKVLVYAYDLSEESCIKIKNVYKNITVRRIHVYGDSILSEKNISTYKNHVYGNSIMSKRTAPMVDALNEGYSKVAHMDVDIIVRGNLDELWENVKANTMKIMYKPDQSDKRKLQKGVFVLGNSNITRALLKRLNEKLERHLEWYDDQKYLWKCYNKFKDQIDFQELGKKYNDNQFSDDSIIWHCSRKNKTVHDKWNKLYNYYKERIL